MLIVALIIMKHICTPCRYSFPKRGMILLLMLVLAALTSLLATTNLERNRQRTLLDGAVAIRMQTDEVLTQALDQGIIYVEKRLRIEDFDVARRGIYKTVDSNRLKYDYRRFALPAQSSVAGVHSGFWIELFSKGATMQNIKGKYYLSCRLLISAYAESADSPVSLSQALVETTLPTLAMPTSDTQVVTLQSLADAKVIATRVFN